MSVIFPPSEFHLRSTPPAGASLAGKGHPVSGLAGQIVSHPRATPAPAEAADRPALIPTGAGRPSDAVIEAALERAWRSVHGCSILTTLRRECIGIRRRPGRRAA